MSEPGDSRIAELLRANAPPPRDAAFRIDVLQRRERQRFQRRSLILFASAIALAVIIAVGFNAGVDIVGIGAVALFCMLCAGCVVFSARGMQELMRRLRTTGKN